MGRRGATDEPRPKIAEGGRTILTASTLQKSVQRARKSVLGRRLPRLFCRYRESKQSPATAGKVGKWIVASSVLSSAT